MRNLFVFLMVFLTACSQTGSDFTPENNFEKEILSLESISSTSLKITLSNLDNFDFENATLNDEENLWKLNANDIARQSYGVDDIDFNKNFDHQVFTNSNKSVDKIDLDALEGFSKNQKLLAEPFLNDILAIKGLELIEIKVNDFNELVTTSTLSNNEKLQLLSIASSVKVLADFLLNDVDEYIRDTSKNSKGCSVDARGVLADAVVDGVCRSRSRVCSRSSRWYSHRSWCRNSCRMCRCWYGRVSCGLFLGSCKKCCKSINSNLW